MKKLINRFLNKIFSNNLRNKGFTLAEVLITLGVIGVIAAITIPTLMNNVQNTKYYSAFEKSYSNLSQITESLILENGDMANVVPSYSSFSQAYLSKAKTIKFCPSATAIGDCWAPTLLRLDGNTDFMSGFAMDTIVFADGSAAAIREWSYDCSSSLSGLSDGCFEIFLDTNSTSPPNKWGRDIFLFIGTKNKLYARGTPGLAQEWVPTNGWYCDTSVVDPNSGRSCASRLIQRRRMDY